MCFHLRNNALRAYILHLLAFSKISTTPKSGIAQIPRFWFSTWHHSMPEETSPCLAAFTELRTGSSELVVGGSGREPRYDSVFQATVF